MPKKKRSEDIAPRLPDKQSTITISKDNKATIGIIQDMLNVAGYKLNGKNIGFIANDAISYLIKIFDLNTEIDIDLLKEVIKLPVEVSNSIEAEEVP